MKKNIFFAVLWIGFILGMTIFFPSRNFVHAASQDNNTNIGTNVKIDKVWQIKFNRQLDKSTVNQSNIVVADSQGNAVPVTVKLEDNGFTVDVASTGSYEYAKDYTITVKRAITTASGTELGKDVQLKFSTVKNQSSNSKFTVTIDAAHGGSDYGNVSSSGTKEKDIDLSVALKTGDILKKNGVNVVYTRTDDKVNWNAEDSTSDAKARVDISNKASSDEFVSIRSNTYPDDPQVKGIETYYSTSKSKSKTVAEMIQKQLVNSTGSVDRGIKEGLAQHKILTGVDASAVMVELGFMSNDSESRLMATEDFQNKCAQAIANGILASLNLADNNPGEVPNSPQPDSPQNGNAPVIVLDPGHGIGQDVGSSGNGYQEDDVTLSVALKAGEILKQKGVNVIYTRTKDERKTSSMTVTESLQRRCDIADNAGARYMISIHTNAFTPSAHGTETLYYTGNSDGERLASLIQSSLVNTLGTYDRGLKDGSWLYITKNTKPTTVLTELGFLTNEGDASILGNDAGRTKAAQAIASAILKALGM